MVFNNVHIEKGQLKMFPFGHDPKNVCVCRLGRVQMVKAISIQYTSTSRQCYVKGASPYSPCIDKLNYTDNHETFSLLDDGHCILFPDNKAGTLKFESENYLHFLSY